MNKWYVVRSYSWGNWAVYAPNGQGVWGAKTWDEAMMIANLMARMFPVWTFKRWDKRL